jgi:hypothetical protein
VSRLVRTPVPLQQLHGRYHDPGLLAKYLGHDKAPLREVKSWKDLGVFPAVAVRAPKEKGAKLSIHLTNRGGGIGAVQVFVNDKEVTADARPARFDADVRRAALTVDLAGALKPDGVNRIRVVAWNKEGSLSNAGLEVDRCSFRITGPSGWPSELSGSITSGRCGRGALDQSRAPARLNHLVMSWNRSPPLPPRAKAPSGIEVGEPVMLPPWFAKLHSFANVNVPRPFAGVLA